jgi:dTMP kinase
MSQGKLVVLTGLDGSGKSSQCDLIKKYFKKNKYKYIHLHFPMYNHNEASDVISSYLRGEYGNINEVNPIFVANMYAMDRFLYLPELQKHLIENDVVLLDRYVFCNMAYQGAKYDTEIQSQIMRDWINEFEFGFLELPYPDLNIFFDVPIDIIEKRLDEKRGGEDRRYLKGKSDIHEMDIEFQKKVRENYLKLKNYQNFEIIETNDLNPKDIFKKYEELLNKLMLIQNI